MFIHRFCSKVAISALKLPIWAYILLTLAMPGIVLLNTTALPVMALEPEVIQDRAAKFIVKIGGNKGGTGFFIRKNNNHYTVLTNRHVVEGLKDTILTTFDSQSHRFLSQNIRYFPGVDLAEIDIDTNTYYPIATLSNKNEIISGSTVYTYGWNAVGDFLKARGLQWLEGKITGEVTARHGSDGYTLSYTLVRIKGLSGSPLLNRDGEVIGVYGAGEQLGLGVGIPISTYYTFVKPISVDPLEDSQEEKIKVSFLNSSNNELVCEPSRKNKYQYIEYERSFIVDGQVQTPVSTYIPNQRFRCYYKLEGLNRTTMFSYFQVSQAGTYRFALKQVPCRSCTESSTRPATIVTTPSGQSGYTGYKD
jgi:hypothetical protein